MHVYTLSLSCSFQEEQGSFDRVVLIHIDKSTSLKVCLLSDHMAFMSSTCVGKTQCSKGGTVWKLTVFPLSFTNRWLFAPRCEHTWSPFNPQTSQLYSRWLLSFTQLPIGPLGARVGTRYPISDLDYPIKWLMYVQRCLKASHPSDFPALMKPELRQRIPACI